MIAAVRRFWAYVWPYRRALLLGGALSLVEVGVSLAQPWPLRWVVDDVLAVGGDGPAPHAELRLTLAVAALVGLVVAGAVVNYYASRLLSAAGLHIASALRVAVLDRLQRLSLAYHGSRRVGDLVARVTSDVAYTQDMIVQVLSTLLPSLLLVVGMFLVMLSLDPGFTLLALLATPPLALATHRSRRQLRQAARGVRKADGVLASAATENLSSVQLIQAFTLEEDRLRRFRGLSDASLSAGLEAVRLQSRFGPLVELSSAASTAVVLWFGAHRVLEGRLSLGVLLVFLSYLGSLYKPIKSLSKLSQTISKGAAAAERITDVMTTPLDIVDRPGAVPVPVRGQVELRSVTFSYGREPVLDDLSFRVEPGQTVALVGPSGAGKSTIAALIPRLLDVDGGAVLVDGVDVRDHPLASLRRRIALVAQDAVLLDGTLRENLVCGHAGASDRDVERAARLALVDEFAARLPDRLDTHIGERGANLSGGQRQRVSIARAILRDAPIVILDEPTSALDAASEELLVAALDNLPADRTRLIVAHRLSTVRDADRILVVDGGRIVESGTHDELVRAGGLYHRLAAFQAGEHRVTGAAARPARNGRHPVSRAGAPVPTAPPAPGR
ncbi:MAG TPA: ABC transporter ATP-binding protein [Acidimicrobiales bacterium]|jgi:ABC-type multidrug transport system fused ATPase/permease subunit